MVEALYTMNRVNVVFYPFSTDMSSTDMSSTHSSSHNRVLHIHLQSLPSREPVSRRYAGIHLLCSWCRELESCAEQFFCELPSGFNNLRRLKTLYLEKNGFTGVLPELELLNLELFNVSFNNLNGSMPKGLEGKPKSAFLGNSLCGKPLDNACTDSGSPKGVEILGKSSENGLSGGAIAGIVIGSVVGLLLLLRVLFILLRKQSGNKARSFDVPEIKNQETGSGGWVCV